MEEDSNLCIVTVPNDQSCSEFKSIKDLSVRYKVTLLIRPIIYSGSFSS
jgi:hypothetical protein